MKKKLLLGLTVLGAASMLCGFDSAETADSLYQKMLDATADASGASMSMGMNLDAAINVSDGTTDSSLGITMSGTFDVNATMDPVATELVGSMDLSALGQGQHMEMKSYSVTAEDGGLETYSFTKESTDDEGSWAYNKDSNIDMTSLMDLSKSLTAADMADWGLTFTLAPEAATVNGTECYELSTVIDSSTLDTVLKKVSELAGEDLTSDQDVAMAMQYLDGLKLNITYYVDAATYLPVSVTMDMNDSDLTVLNSLIASTLASEEGTSAELVLNDFSINATTSYGDVAAITVPQEAIDAVAAGEATSLDDVAENLVADAETEAAEATTEAVAE